MCVGGGGCGHFAVHSHETRANFIKTFCQRNKSHGQGGLKTEDSNTVAQSSTHTMKTWYAESICAQ